MTTAPPGPLESPAAWRGGELFARKDWLRLQTLDDWAEIDSAIDEASGLDLEAIDPHTFPLPTLGSQFRQLQDTLEYGSGACMIRGFDVDRWSENQAKKVFLGIAQHIGTPVSQSAQGEKVFSVRDEGFDQEDSRSRGPNTSKKLSFHTDRCDVIGFLCLRMAKSGGENEIVSSISVYNEIARLRPDLLKILMEPFLYKRHNVDSGNKRPYCKQPIFSFCEGHFACAFLRVLIDRAYADKESPDLTPEQQEALDFVEDVAADPDLHVRFSQEPGDMLFLNNWTTLHRRTAFEDHGDPKLRRHLLRIWLSVPNSRPLDPMFADNYGAVKAGAIRGGMQKQ